MRILALVLTAAAVSACATSYGPSRYQVEMDELEASCDARGGILQPTGRIEADRPQEKFVCRITGGPSERLQRPGG